MLCGAQTLPLALPPPPPSRTPSPSPGAVFAPLSVPGARLFMAKAAYVGLNLVGLGVVLWKVKAMGLLPVTSADWVSLLPQRLPLQLAAAGTPV
jgi:hypothetical protein